MHLPPYASLCTFKCPTEHVLRHAEDFLSVCVCTGWLVHCPDGGVRAKMSRESRNRAV